MRTRRPLVRPALAAAALLGGALALPAVAADAPRTSAVSSTFYLAQEGCGAEAGAGQLITKATPSSGTGCGTIGGLPLDEVLYQVDGPAYTDYSTVGKGLPITLDAARKITGQVAAGSWVGVGGVGSVDFDITLTGRTAKGVTVDFGSTTTSVMAAGPDAVVVAPFELTVPAEANGQAFTSFSFGLATHGANVGMSAQQYDGDSYLVLPTKAPAKKKK